MSKQALERLTQQFPGEVLSTFQAAGGDDVAVVKPERILEICQFLKADAELKFDMLSTVTCVDRLMLPESSPRFEIIYQLLSLTSKKRLRIKTHVDEANGKPPHLSTVLSVWKTADWWERLIWDMYGVTFDGHHNMKRLYLYEEFKGHPLRKDYPLRGRQPLIPERDFRDAVRGPGVSPRD